MKAMILAAGLGTRLKPLTEKRPKVLVPVGNRPIIDWVIDYLKRHGIHQVIVNAHHHAELLKKHLGKGAPYGIQIEVREEPKIIGTGGGIKNTSDFWDDEPFLVINGDVMTDIDLTAAFEAHRRVKPLATLILHDYGPFNKIRLGKNGTIAEIPRKVRPHFHGRLAFTGIHIIDPVLLRDIRKGVFSDIVDCYRDLINKGETIRSHTARQHHWRDIGSVESYALANKERLKTEPFLLGSGCEVHPDARLKEWAIVGAKAFIEENAEIRRSIIWDHVHVHKSIKIVDSIVTSSKEVQTHLNGQIL